MANEIIFNLNINASQNVSSFAFRNGMDGIFYYRPYFGSYLTNWSTVSTIKITYVERNSPSNNYTLTLTSADIVNINGEDLMKVTLPSAMINHSAVYDGVIRINNASKTILTSILVYDAATIEISLMRSLILDYENSLYNYLKTIKKDKLNAANGVAILDSKRIILEEYLPASYKQHIDSKIRTTEVHKIKLDGQGVMWYFDSDNNTWKQGRGQNGSSGHIPPTLTVRDGIVIIKHDPSTVVALQKYDEGQKDITYFGRNGKNISGSSFTVSKYGIYTYYYKTSGGYENVIIVSVKETDIPFPAPSYTVTEGLVKITHKDESKIKLQKWASGSRPVSYFESQGTEITNNSFLVDSSGQYTLYYELLDGRKFVMPITVSEDNLPIDIPPTVNKKNGIITLKFDPKMSIEISKWDEGIRAIEYFNTAGNVIVNNAFKVSKAGDYTIYYKTTRGKESVLVITISQEELKPDPVVRFEIVKGEVTVIYPDYIFPQLSKWETGSRDITYFQNKGNIFVGNKFTVTQAGQHTLYFKDQDDMEYVRPFTVKITDLPPNIKPSYSKMNGKIIISVENKALYDQSKFIIGFASIEDFRNGAGENVVNWEIPITVKGTYIHYYRVLDGQDGLEEIVIMDDDLPHSDPNISIKNGLATITHTQPSGITVLEQKWDIGIKAIEYFYNSGNIVTNNKFYVTQAGEHTLYYKLSNGGEYVMKFVVTENSLEKPQPPATITIVRGKVTVVYPAGTVIAIQKWTTGKDIAISYFQNNGNVFTENSFTVAEIGWYTLYYKLENEKEYTQSFEVKESNIFPEFIDPVITIVRGLATINYDNSMDVTMTKWEYGINTIQHFETEGNLVVGNTFTVTQVGTHTLYTVLENKYKYLSTFEVTEDQLPKQDKPPIINTVEGVVTITHDSQTQVDIQKWATGNRDVAYFQSEGTVFTGNTFSVSVKGEYTYYYKNIHGDEYVYSFTITEDNLPFYPPIIQVFDALLTIEFTSPHPVTVNKIDTGVRDKSYFASNGNNIIGGRYPIIAAGEYTIYWKENNGNDYINIFTVTESQIQYHQTPKILVNNKNVSVEFTQDVETFVSEKKYSAGDQAVEWFNNNGLILESNSFTLENYGKYTYYYKYRNRGYILSFTAIDLSHLVPLSTIELEKEFIFGGRVWTKLVNTADTTIIADETPYIQSGIFGASSTISPNENGSIGKQLLSLYANPSNYRLDEFNAILTRQWSNGTISNPTEKQYQSKVGMKNYQEAIDSRTRLSNKGLTGEYWTSTYVDNLNVYAENITNKTISPYNVSTNKDIRGLMHVEKETLVEKVPLISIQNGIVTVIDPDNPPPPEVARFDFTIDESISNPNDAVSYSNEIASFTPATYDKLNKTMNFNSWSNRFPFNEIKPCIIKNGIRQFYVNPDNFSQKEDGTSFDKTEGDLMIEFPKMYYKVGKTGTKINVSMSKNKLDSTYQAVAFTKGASEYNYLYLSAYTAGDLGTSGNYYFGSRSGGLPAKDTIVNARTKVTKNNPNYSLITFQSLDFIKLLYVLLFKSIDKAIMGIGSLNLQTLKGDMDRMGMFRGGLAQNESDDWVKIFGMEHIWGDEQYAVDGIYLLSDSSGRASVANNNFNSNGTGYTDTGFNTFAVRNRSGVITTMSGASNLVFMPIGNTTTANNTNYNSSCAITATANPVIVAGGQIGNLAKKNEFGLFRLSTVTPATLLAHRIQYLSNN